MGILHRLLDPLFSNGGMTVEKPEVTEESIRLKIGVLRLERAESDRRFNTQLHKIEESLKIFPIGFSASAEEIAAAYNNCEYEILIPIVLNKLAESDNSGWKAVRFGCSLMYKRVA